MTVLDFESQSFRSWKWRFLVRAFVGLIGRASAILLLVLHGSSVGSAQEQIITHEIHLQGNAFKDYSPGFYAGQVVCGSPEIPQFSTLSGRRYLVRVDLFLRTTIEGMLLIQNTHENPVQYEYNFSVSDFVEHSFNSAGGVLVAQRPGKYINQSGVLNRGSLHVMHFQIQRGQRAIIPRGFWHNFIGEDTVQPDVSWSRTSLFFLEQLGGRISRINTASKADSVLLVEYRYMSVPDLPPVSVSNASAEVSGQEESEHGCAFKKVRNHLTSGTE